MRRGRGGKVSGTGWMKRSWPISADQVEREAVSLSDRSTLKGYQRRGRGLAVAMALVFEGMSNRVCGRLGGLCAEMISHDNTS